MIWPRQKLVFAVDRPYIPNDCDPVYEDLTLHGEFGTFPIGYDLVAAQAILVAELPEGLVRVTVVNNLNASIHGAGAVLLIDASGRLPAAAWPSGHGCPPAAQPGGRAGKRSGRLVDLKRWKRRSYCLKTR